MKLDDWVKVALVGTAHAPAAASAEGSPLAHAIASLPPASPEAQLLRQIALTSAYEFCGRTPAEGASPPAPAPPDTRAACSPRAEDLLSQLLSMTNTPTKQQLLDEWLTLAAFAKRRASHRLLPNLLDYGAAHRVMRPRVADVVDARGHWLMSQNPRWQYSSGESEDVGKLWSTGTADQRLAIIRRVRAGQPAQARDLIASTWAEDAANDRATFVAAMAVSLGNDDEPFLESILDDRSKQVRAAAADLLSRLPTSAYVARMAERAGALLKFQPGAKGGLLRKATPASIEVTLPASLESTWVRDGITEKPPVRLGEKQWWLQQMTACVPPKFWSNRWGVEPTECIAAAAGDYQDVLLNGWTDAAVKHTDAGWARALLHHAASQADGRIRVDLLESLPADARSEMTAEFLSSKQFAFEAVVQFIAASKFAFDRAGAKALFAQIDRRAERTGAQYDYAMQGIMAAVALRVPADAHDELAARWTGPYWDSNRNSLDQCLQILQMRRDIRREFSEHNN